MAQDNGDPAGEWARMQAMARDWATIWQSELAAAALDREVQEGWQAMLALWASGLSGAAPDERNAWTAVAAWAAPAAAASFSGSDARDAELARLAERVAELERRLAAADRSAAV